LRIRNKEAANNSNRKERENKRAKKEPIQAAPPVKHLFIKLRGIESYEAYRHARSANLGDGLPFTATDADGCREQHVAV
jgi:hypothetical protein